MTKRIGLLCVSALVTLGACDGGSGGADVDGGKTLATLSADERSSLCEWGNAQFPSDPVTCGPDNIWEPSTDAECVADLALISPNCTVTVSQLETCVAGLAGDVCSTDVPEACGSYFACFQQR